MNSLRCNQLDRICCVVWCCCTLARWSSTGQKSRPRCDCDDRQQRDITTTLPTNVRPVEKLLRSKSIQLMGALDGLLRIIILLFSRSHVSSFALCVVGGRRPTTCRSTVRSFVRSFGGSLVVVRPTVPVVHIHSLASPSNQNGCTVRCLRLLQKNNTYIHTLRTHKRRLSWHIHVGAAAAAAAVTIRSLFVALPSEPSLTCVMCVCVLLKLLKLHDELRRFVGVVVEFGDEWSHPPQDQCGVQVQAVSYTHLTLPTIYSV